ncbi:beta strand repeat-containing protein [Uliginosibacterium sp. sgz301328]|uniref:beta strand repeat-containing protein n=1 Tax=Uliginosibacterium sp. sgz301328 TaxID=3243764 RepID=UPI00359E7209
MSNSNAISLGNNAIITLGAGASVTNNASTSTGLWGGGPNTIEFGSNGRLTVGVGASVTANGSQNNGEPVNVFGVGNVITNYGIISSRSGAAIWFEDKVGGGGNTVDNYGIIRTQLGANANVIGNNANGPVTFINRTGARVEGSLSFAGGDDKLTLEAGSVITGSFNGGGGNNSLTLGGVLGSSDSLAGDIRNFQTLTKTGLGIWTLTGAIGANGGGVPLQVVVDEGTLALTGNNANFNGGVTVNAAGVLEARAQSLPPSVVDNGLVRFTQDSAGTYAGLISGSGAVDKTLGGDLTLSGTNTYGGGTTINAGTLFISGDANLGAASGGLTLNGGALGSVANVTTSRATTVTTAGGGLNTAAGTTLTMNGVIGGAGQLAKTGSGTAVLAGTNSYAGGTSIFAGVLQAASDANLGATSGALTFDGGTLDTTEDMATARATLIMANGGTLQTEAGTTLSHDGTISGSGTLAKTGDGTLVLSGNNTQAGGTAINGGVVQIASDANLGDAGAAVSFDGGTLRAANGMTIARSGTLNAGGGTIEVGGDPFQSANDVTFSGAISGAGSLNKIGTGTLVLNGTNTYTGATNVTDGQLSIHGDQSAMTGAINVSGAGTRLIGDGVYGGSVNLSNGASFGPAFAPNTPAKLTINGNLNIGSDAVLLYNIVNTAVGGALNDLTTVNGNLTLDGRIDVLDQGQTLGPGVYRIINYSGALTDNGLTVGNYVDVTDTMTRVLTGLSVQTAVPGQINLINTTGLSLTYWDGNTSPNNGVINGGNGVWLIDPSIRWTDPAGAVNAPWSDEHFAIFIGAPGTVTVDDTAGQVSASGMQFGVDGYRLQGAELDLVGGNSTIRVGDGTTAGSAMTATISAPLAGGSLLHKTDAGTLVLSGANTYTGGTSVEGGVLRISSDANLGAAAGGLTLDSGTLNTTASITTGRATQLNSGGGIFDTAAGTTLTLANAVTGAGALTHMGTGNLTLLDDAVYEGGTTNAAGTLQLGNGGTAGSVVGDIANDAALLVNRSDTLALSGIISGAGTLEQAGAGTTILTADNTYAGSTTISAGTLQLGNGGFSGSVAGSIVDNAALVINHSNDITVGNLISGTGSLQHMGTGSTFLTGDNSYMGTTTVTAGRLFIRGDQSAATGDTNVSGAGTRLSGDGIIGGNVNLSNGASFGPGSTTNTPAQLTINGNLQISSDAVLVYNIIDTTVGGALNDLTIVNGALTLDGRIDVIDQGQNLGPGVYRIINYSGPLTNNGLTIGSYTDINDAPTRPLDNFSVQTAVPGQVNLVNTNGMALTYWDGSGVPNSNTIDGGNGIWLANPSDPSARWTDLTGAANAPWANGQVAIFSGAPGTVTVDDAGGAVDAAGMQFGTDGYLLQGGAGPARR